MSLCLPRLHTRAILLGASLSLVPAAAFAQAPNAATDWSLIVQQAIHNASAPRSAGTSEILHATVMLAMYDAAVTVTGTHQPYAAAIPAAPGADLRAAVATAAYRTATARIAPSQVPNLDLQYASYMGMIPMGPARTEGVNVGEQVAQAILAARANDNFGVVVPYECSSLPPAVGEFEPDAGCPASPGSPQPVDVKAGRILPFTFADAARFRPDGPDPLNSEAYADDFEETRELGRFDSAVRTAEQTDIAYFWSENPYVHWNRNITALAVAQGLDLAETTRFFAMVHTTAADAIIAGFEAKYFYTAWRPRTAIPLADYDGNPLTAADPSWRPLFSVNHPEYPSGHGFWSTAVVDSVAAFFGTNKVTWTIETSKAAVPLVVKTSRTYGDLNALMREIGNSRIWAGLHWRHAIRHGEQVGRRVAMHVTRNYFRPVRGRGPRF
jgi:hypothetical protein